MTKEYLSDTQQSIFDVALMQYGSIEGLAWLLADNPGLLFEDGTFSQFRVGHKIRPNASIDARMKSAMLNIRPASGRGEDPAEWVMDDGVTVWTNQTGASWITDPS